MMNRPVTIGLVICIVLAAAFVLRLASGRSKPVRPAPPTTVLMRCADNGQIIEIPFARARRIADQLRGGNPDATAADIPLCPATGKPYVRLVFASCPDTGKLFVIAFGASPDQVIDTAFLRRMSPYIHQDAGPTGEANNNAPVQRP